MRRETRPPALAIAGTVVIVALLRVVTPAVRDAARTTAGVEPTGVGPGGRLSASRSGGDTVPAVPLPGEPAGVGPGGRLSASRSSGETPPAVALALQGEPDDIVVARNWFADGLAWATIDKPATWSVVDAEPVSGLRISSEDPLDIASWYGQATTHTWGVMAAYADENGDYTTDGEPPLPGCVVTVTETTVDGLPASRTDYRDAEGTVDAAIVVTVPMGANNAGHATYLFRSEIAGAPGAAANALRQQLDLMYGSITLVPDYASQLQWTRTWVDVSSSQTHGYDVSHPVGWSVDSNGAALSLVSPGVEPYAAGIIRVVVTTADAEDASKWDGAPALQYWVLHNEAREIEAGDVATSLPFVPTTAFLVVDGNDVAWLVAIANPADSFGAATYWLYDQVIYRVITESMLEYPFQPAAYP